MRKLARSIISAFAGWSAGLVLAACWYLGWIPYVPRGMVGRDAWIALVIYAVISAVFIFTVWAAVLVPLYFVIPPRSILWRWPVCTLCGGLAGAAIMSAWTRIYSPLATDWSQYVILAGIIGGVTCFIAALTADRSGV